MKLKFRRLYLYIVGSALTIVWICSASGNMLHVQAADNAKVHYLVLPGNTEGVLLECNGKFGMVDSGEDYDYPTGGDVRYPYREGIIEGQGSEDQVIEYMKSLGVTQDNFEFYIGTHAHSDHIGSADEIIREFHPKRVYIQEYKDEYIKNSGRLWDNLYCYDNMIQAAKDVNASLILGFDSEAPVYPEKVVITGRIILEENEGLIETTEEELEEELEEETVEEQYVDESAGEIMVTLWNDESNTEVDVQEITVSSQTIDVEFPGISKYAEDGHEISYSITVERDNEPLDCVINMSSSEDVTCENNVGRDRFSLGGDMDIQIYNYGDFYKSTNAVNDANDFSLGVLVTANGKRVFLSGDINNSAEGQYAESRLLKELGHVDILTLGHHGASGSNSYSYVSGLSPEIMVLSGDFSYVSGTLDDDGYTLCETLRSMSEKKVPLYVTEWFVDEMDAIVFSLGDQITSNLPKETRKIAYTKNDLGGTALCYHNGLQEKYKGWLSSNGYVSYFNDSVYGLKTKKWMLDLNGEYHYFDGTGICKTGWVLDGGKYYYLGEDTVMKTGWQTINGKEYYFKSTGALATGWQKNNNGNWLYYNSGGNVVTGWLKTGGHWYYLGENGHMLTGWQTINNKEYYFKSTGALTTGWQKNNNGNWLYYNSGGNVVTGWLKTGGRWYYLDVDGHMLTGKQKIGGAFYYLTASGAMKTGWNQEGNWWYYYGSSGAMRTNAWINGKYYLKSDGTMARSEWVDSGRYYVDQNGRWVPGKAP